MGVPGTSPVFSDKSNPGTSEHQPTIGSPGSNKWELHVDGASNSGGSGAGLVLVSPDQYKTNQALCFNFKASNNEAEYEAVIIGLELALELRVRDIEIFSDSMLVVNQINREFQAKEERMAKYLGKVYTLLNRFENHLVTRVPRSENVEADALARLASGSDLEGLVSFPIERLDQPSVTREEHVLHSEDTTSWMEPIIRFLADS